MHVHPTLNQPAPLSRGGVPRPAASPHMPPRATEARRSTAATYPMAAPSWWPSAGHFPHQTGFQASPPFQDPMASWKYFPSQTGGGASTFGPPPYFRRHLPLHHPSRPQPPVVSKTPREWRRPPTPLGIFLHISPSTMGGVCSGPCWPACLNPMRQYAKIFFPNTHPTRPVRGGGSNGAISVAMRAQSAPSHRKVCPQCSPHPTCWGGGSSWPALPMAPPGCPLVTAPAALRLLNAHLCKETRVDATCQTPLSSHSASPLAPGLLGTFPLP